MQGKPIEFDFKQEASSTINTNTNHLRLTKQITDPNDINLHVIKEVRPGSHSKNKRDRIESKQNVVQHSWMGQDTGHSHKKSEKVSFTGTND